MELHKERSQIGSSKKNNSDKEIKVRIRYTDGHYEIRIFKSKPRAEWDMAMEGDHVHSWEYI